jgi:hypothetical protein
MIDGAPRHWASSTLWKENVLDLNHSAVWGSWYDKTTKRWGYKCCQNVGRGDVCPNAPLPEVPSDSDEESQDSVATDASTRARKKRNADRPVSWLNPPLELASREEIEAPDAFLAHFVRFAVGAWGRVLDEKRSHDPGFQPMFVPSALKQAEDDLAPLIKQCEGEKLAGSALLGLLDKMVSCAADREYYRASQVYTQLTLGNKKWNQCLSQYGGPANTNKGARMYIVEASEMLDYDKDPVVQRYIHCMKKLIYVTQCVRPNADVGKHVRA